MAHSFKTVGIAIVDRKKSNMVDLSIRGRNLVELNKVVPEIAKLIGGSGGGHKNAVGTRIPSNKVDLFLKKLDEKIESLKIKNPAKIDPFF